MTTTTSAPRKNLPLFACGIDSLRMQRFLLPLALLSISCFAGDSEVPLTLQSRNPAGLKKTVQEKWLPAETAMIVCDMWDLHHCKNAVTREGEMAPRMNDVLEKARAEGI